MIIPKTTRFYIDNAPTESWFWHIKDELDIQKMKTYEEAEKEVSNYIIYYNNFRLQRTKKKMTPIEYRNHLIKDISFI